MPDIDAILRPARWGLRVRSALITAVVVAVVLGLGAAVSLWLLHRSLIDSVDSSASTRAEEIATELGERTPADLRPRLLATDGRIDVIQILNADGAILRASDAAPAMPLIPVPPGGRTSGRPVAGESDLRVAARTEGSGAGAFTVLVASNSESGEETLKKVAIGVGSGGPLVVLVAAAATYALVGRSLSSVDDIRARVAQIGADRLTERVPVPAARDEIARLAETMNAMLDRVESSRAAQRRFVSDASHELRSPLTTVIAALEMGRDHPQVLDRRLITDTLLPEAERIRDLVEDMLTLAALDEQHSPVRRVEIDLDDLTATAVSVLGHHTSVTVTTDLAPARVVGDRRALQRVIGNLLDNAARHARSAITVRTEATATGARVIIDDDGPGIPISERARVFERFVRLHDDRGRATGGTGLGLAIVDRIVTAHHGSITVSESGSGGARFIVDLPVGQLG